MAIAVIGANEIRIKLRDVLDGIKEQDVVIERYGRPVATVISFDDYRAILETLEDVRDTREALAAVAEYERDPTTAESWEELRAQWVKEGILVEG